MINNNLNTKNEKKKPTNKFGIKVAFKGFCEKLVYKKNKPI